MGRRDHGRSRRRCHPTCPREEAEQEALEGTFETSSSAKWTRTVPGNCLISMGKSWAYLRVHVPVLVPSASSRSVVDVFFKGRRSLKDYSKYPQSPSVRRDQAGKRTFGTGRKNNDGEVSCYGRAFGKEIESPPSSQHRHVSGVSICPILMGRSPACARLRAQPVLLFAPIASSCR